MNDRDNWTVDAMEKYGGGFVKALAQCARQADSNNLLRIKQAWPEYWAQYEEDGKKMESEEE